jgi:hypothetical protein
MKLDFVQMYRNVPYHPKEFHFYMFKFRVVCLILILFVSYSALPERGIANLPSIKYGAKVIKTSKNVKISIKSAAKPNYLISKSNEFNSPKSELASKKIVSTCFPSQCKFGSICGNEHFKTYSSYDPYRNFWIVQQGKGLASDQEISCSSFQRQVKIAIVSSWVSDSPVNISSLNHYQYATLHNYRYFHYQTSKADYRAQHLSKLHHPSQQTIPSGWSSVEYVLQLMEEHPEIDYFLKLDMDCLFARTNLPVESFLDPFQQYSLYFTQIEESRFIQSHLWIVKNSFIGKEFLRNWLEFRYNGHCFDIAQEQGALNLLIGRYMKEMKSEETTPYDCDLACNTLRNAYLHHHCVLDWYQDNRMNISYSWNHPDVFLYPYLNSRKTFVSPNDGISAQIGIADLHRKVPDDFQPFSIHPCKNSFSVSASDLLQNISVYCGTARV